VGFRRLLNRQTAAEPLARLAELGRAETPTPTSTRQIRQLNASSDAAPMREACVDKMAEPVLVVVDRKEEAAPRSRSGYMWVSQRTRDARMLSADFADQTF
jgi:hypothetical protein